MVAPLAAADPTDGAPSMKTFLYAACMAAAALYAHPALAPETPPAPEPKPLIPLVPLLGGVTGGS